MNEKLKEVTIKNYLDYLKGEDLEDTLENVDLYVSTLWYDLIDDIEINREIFHIDKNIDDYDAAEIIEDNIKEILINKYKLKF